jgi:mannose-6-phosphate isomerase-like protein (cupin superfamily)
MNRVFKIDQGYQVPDGTIVSPFLNSRDSESDLPWDLVEGFSIAGGEIAPNSKSKIHVMPLVQQVTFVLRGKLEVCMKDIHTSAPYTLELGENQAVLTLPGTFFQLINCTDSPCRVLYIVNPPYLFYKEGEQVLYDDSICFDEDWKILADWNWQPPKLQETNLTAESRLTAAERVALGKRFIPTKVDDKMFVKNLEDCEEIIVADKIILKEFLRPVRDGINLRYSIAHARVKPGDTSSPHKIRTTEVYFILKGSGIIHINGVSKEVKDGCAIYIPPNAVKYIRNAGNEDLEFLCITDPAWRSEDEVKIE